MDKLRAMELLVATAESGSFSAAGRLYGLSPASVSRHVNELEASLGVTLIHRSTRALTLTEAGQRYHRDASDILASVKAAENAASDQNESPRGILRVHSRTMFGVSVLSRLQPSFSQLYPDLVVDLHLSEQPVRLREDGFDLDFRIAPPAEQGLVRRRLFLSQRILVASPAYLARTPAITCPQDLSAHDCLTYWTSHERVYWRFRDGETEHELAIPTVFSSNNGLVLLNMALAGQGIALLDDYTVADQIASGALVVVLPDMRVTNATFEEGIFVTYPEAPFIPAKLRLYIDFVVAHWGRALREGSLPGRRP
ncbi:LysR family transcriptional regulator [Pararhodobacter zhoushanensis]|uniref:LysR family transcriptional regulator n=1 Tax=Pararhodobacter zhoushanensis TaxID=2479545 RepID=UPI000F8CBD47|nr:LysR family transcriptional regulator [Pararhodobacter zhoushanensis]